MTQKTEILFFFFNNQSMEYTPKDISKEFPTFAKSSVRRVLQELLADNKLIRETRGHYNFNDEEEEEPPTIFKKTLGVTLYCQGLEKNFKAVLFESTEYPDREDELRLTIERFTNDDCGDKETKKSLGYEVEQWFQEEELGEITIEQDN